MARDDSTEIRFDGVLTLATAEQTRERLMAAMAQGGDIVVDCAAAETVDLSFVQLLVAAREAARHGDRSLHLAAPAAGALLDTLQRGGFLADDVGGGSECRFWMKEEV